VQPTPCAAHALCSPRPVLPTPCAAHALCCPRPVLRHPVATGLPSTPTCNPTPHL
jgi:hypothetical protein